MTGSSLNLFRYHGKSMWPCFQEGDLLEVKPIDGNRLRKGDCIVWEEAGGHCVVHRVISIRGGLRTRGDAMAQEDCFDEAVTPPIGRVVRRCRLGRWSPVATGFRGCWAGNFYQYAGRFDPARDARGGQLARVFRAMTWPLAKKLMRRCATPVGSGSRVEAVFSWRIAGRVLVVETPYGEIPWPWRLILRNDPE